MFAPPPARSARRDERGLWLSGWPWLEASRPHSGWGKVGKASGISPACVPRALRNVIALRNVVVVAHAALFVLHGVFFWSALLAFFPHCRC